MKPIAVEPLLASMLAEIKALQLDAPLLIGIHTGGAWLASYLHHALNLSARLGSLDISFYRDDFSRIGLHPSVKSSDLPEAIDDRQIILVDDVLHTGRTIRAALNEIFSYGRPAMIKLVVALERPGRELPIRADVIGKSIPLAANQQAKIGQDDAHIWFDIVTIDNNN